jgi:hypothetical protein
MNKIIYARHMPNWFFGVGSAAFIGKLIVLRFGPWEIALLKEAPQ